jgi:hypothetical protein
MKAAEEPLLSPTVEFHIVRLATIIAASVAVAYLILGSFDAGSRSLLGRAITPSVVALTGLLMIGRRRYRADLLLAVGVGLMIIQVEVFDNAPIRNIAGMAIIAAAAAGAYVTRWRLRTYQVFSRWRPLWHTSPGIGMPPGRRRRSPSSWFPASWSGSRPR